MATRARRFVLLGLVSFSSVVGTLLIANAIGVPPWLSVPGAFTLAVIVGFLLGARNGERSPTD